MVLRTLKHLPLLGLVASDSLELAVDGVGGDGLEVVEREIEDGSGSRVCLCARLLGGLGVRGHSVVAC